MHLKDKSSQDRSRQLSDCKCKQSHGVTLSPLDLLVAAKTASFSD